MAVYILPQNTSRISVILHTILHTFLRTCFFDYINMITQISNNSKFYMFTIIYTIAFTVCFCFDFIFLLSIYFPVIQQTGMFCLSALCKKFFFSLFCFMFICIFLHLIFFPVCAGYDYSGGK